MANEVTSDKGQERIGIDSWEYRTDPQHQTRPKGIGWVTTQKGWKRQTRPVAKPTFPKKAMNFGIEFKKIGSEILADNKDYKYDPDHKNKPVGGNWKETESGWTTKKQEKTPDRKRQNTPLRGMMNTLDVLGKYVKQNENGKFVIEDKDWERISSILKKSNGDEKKANHYSMNMAQAITDPAKAVRRGIATYDSLKGSFGSAVAIEIANVFFNRAMELQSKEKRPAVPLSDAPQIPKEPSFLRGFLEKVQKINGAGLLSYKNGKAVVEPKDIERIDSILAKSNGDKTKAEMYVKNMANAITDATKAARRGAATIIGFKRAGYNALSRRLADIFFTKALELNTSSSAPAPKPISDSNPPKPDEVHVKETPAKPVSNQPKFRKIKPKLPAALHYLIKNNKLKADEIEELTGFKNSIIGHPMMSDKEFKRRVENGLKLPRNQHQLKNSFIRHMDIRNYGSPEAFQNAKDRIQKMSVMDFGKLLGAIMAEEETE